MISKLTWDTRLILDRLTTNVILLNNELIIQYANTAAQQLFAFSQKRLNGSPITQLCDHISLDLTKMKHNLSKHYQFIDNEICLTIHGREHYLTLNAQQFNEDAILLELIELEQQHRFNQEYLQTSQQAVTKEIIRGLAHEIKNPLGGLRGAAQLLEHELPNDDLKEYTQIIIEQSDRLHNLVDRLLGPQRLTQRTLHNIHQTIERVYKLLELEKPEHVHLSRDYDPSLPEFIFDPEQIEQVLLNISRNALQALENQLDGNIKFSTRTAFQVTINGKRHRLCVKITIADSGPGLPSEIRDTLFYPMVSGRANGSGLGLSIARTLVDQHQGKIEFDSWAGHTEFSVYLPIEY